MLNFVFCFVVLALSGFLFRSLWCAFIAPVTKSFVLNGRPPLNLAWLIWALVQLYIIFGWATICVSIVHIFIAKPGVSFWWAYYILAFFGCGAPIHDRTPGNSNTIFFFSMISFIGFSVFPKLSIPWQWFLRFLPQK